MRIFKNQWPILFLSLLVILYFAPILFFPQPKIFFNPDYGLSDVTHFNLPMRQLLHDSIKDFKLPLWSQKIGAGFPVFAEGQSGDLSLLNLLTAWLPLWFSFNLSYVFAFLLMTVLTYLFCCEVGLSKVSSALAAVVFAFSGSNFAHFNHLNQLTTVTWLPMEFWLLEKGLQSLENEKRKGREQRADFRKRRTRRGWFDSWEGKGLVWWLLLSFAASQQIFGGKMQFVIYSWVALFLYLAFRAVFIENVSRKKRLLGQICLFVCAAVLAMGLSAVQILPSLELTKLTQRAGGLSFEQTTQYPYLVKHLLTFLNPYLLGDPRNGTYPRFSATWGLFWENTAYIGVVPLLLVAALIVYLIVKGGCFLTRKRWRTEASRLNFEDKELKIEAKSTLCFPSSNLHSPSSTFYPLFFLFLALFFLLFAFGKYSPFSFIFNFPPLNYFRVPSRMLTLVDFSLAILAGFGLEIILNLPRLLPPVFRNPFSVLLGKMRVSLVGLIVVGLLLAATLLDLFYFSAAYSPTVEVSKYLQAPKTVEFLRQDQSQFRVLDVGSAIAWNQIFLQKGWQDQKKCYLRLREGLAANLNLLWGVESFSSYMGITPLAQVRLMGVVQGAFLWNEQKAILVSPAALKVLSFYNVKYLIAPFSLAGQGLEEVQVIGAGKNSSGGCGAVIRVYKNTQVLPRVFMVESIAQNFADPFDKSFYQVTNQNFKDQETSFSIQNQKNGFLVLADSFYPGWKALVDGQEKRIYKVNFNQRAVFLPQGKHQVSFIYQPKSFRMGLAISGASFCVWILVLFYPAITKKRYLSIQRKRP